MTLLKTKRIFFIDASSIRESACIRRFFWTVVQGYKAKLASNDMIYGSAFHKFVETLDKTDGNIGEAIMLARQVYNPKNYIVKPKKQYMTMEHLLATCMDWFTKRWLPVHEGKTTDTFRVLQLNGQAVVEKKFAIPWYSCDLFDLVLAGTMDKLGRFMPKGAFAICDYKTTSSWDVKEYFKSYVLDPQFNVYTLVIRKLAKLFPGSIFDEIVATRLSYFIEGIFIKSEGSTFERSTVMTIKPERLVKFEAMLNHLVLRLAAEITKWIAAGEPANTCYVNPEGEVNGACKTVYGACKFHAACGAPDEIATLHVLKNNYKQHPYNPLEFGELI